MIGVLATGFAVGITHALEPDHLASVGAMAANEDLPSQSMVKFGATWGFGHALALALLGFSVLQFGITPTEQVNTVLECCLAVIIIVLAVKALLRLKLISNMDMAIENPQQSNLALSKHQTAISHGIGQTSSNTKNQFKTLLIGFLHGTAGSSAVLVLAITITHSYWTVMSYILVFGLGSIFGMVAISKLVSLSFALAERKLQHLLGLFITIVAYLAILAGMMLIASKLYGNL